MKHWTIGRKLLSVVGLLVGLFALSVGLVYRSTVHIEETIRVVEQATDRLQEFDELMFRAERLLFLDKAVIAAAYARDRENFDELRAEAETLVGVVKAKVPEIQATLLLQANRETVQAFEAGVNEWHRLFQQSAAAAAAGRPDEAQALSTTRSRPLMEANVHHLEAAVERIKQQVTEAQEADHAAIASLLVTLMALLTVALAAGGLAVYVVLSINKALRHVVTTLSEGAEQVASASSQVSTSAQSLSQGATEQAASLEETSASMEEMAAMTRRNAEQSQQAAALMGEVDRQVAQSNAALHAMVGSMASIQESSTKVSKIIKTIDEIAFQTNILALNAAVEAARAGDAGMGFAVVADEVRNLAQRSAQAAKDTAGLIEESSTNAAQGAAKVDQVAASITEITGSVGQVKEIVEGVSLASKQQAQGIDQVTQAVSQMEKVTQTTAATAEESAAASEELNAQAEQTMAAVRSLATLVGGAQAGAPAVRMAPQAAKRAAAPVLTLARSSGVSKKASDAEAEAAIPLGDTGTFGKF